MKSLIPPSTFFKQENYAFFFIQLLLETARKFVLVARCLFSDLSTEGLAKKSKRSPTEGLAKQPVDSDQARQALDTSFRGVAHHSYSRQKMFALGMAMQENGELGEAYSSGACPGGGNGAFGVSTQGGCDMQYYNNGDAIL